MYSPASTTSCESSPTSSDVESQNWLMGAGERRVGRELFRLHSMLSFEPFTIQALGSPQVFQTGETYQEAPLIDYQHPHDLVMDLGADWTRPVPRGRMLHRALRRRRAGARACRFHAPRQCRGQSDGAARASPDGRHAYQPRGRDRRRSAGRADARRLMVSWRRARREPDRGGVRPPRLGTRDGCRGSTTAGTPRSVPAHLTTPEWVEPFSDVTRLTASVAFTRPDGRLATLLSWGQNREIHGNLDAYLFEATVRPYSRHSWYTREELVTKDILNPGGRHPRGFTHFHELSRVASFTGGYEFKLGESKMGRFGLGGDVTVYHVAENLLDNYGAPASFHVFLHYNPNRPAMHMMH